MATVLPRDSYPSSIAASLTGKGEIGDQKHGAEVVDVRLHRQTSPAAQGLTVGRPHDGDPYAGLRAGRGRHDDPMPLRQGEQPGQDPADRASGATRWQPERSSTIPPASRNLATLRHKASSKKPGA